MSKINIADYVENTEVEGPGKRFALCKAAFAAVPAAAIRITSISFPGQLWNPNKSVH